MTEKDQLDGIVAETEASGETPRDLVQNITAKQIAIVSSVVAAGCYGYGAAKWGNYAVDAQSAQPYPEYAWLFFLLGLSIGVAFCAWLVDTTGGDDDD